MGGGESKNSQLLKYGGLLSETERETLRMVFSNIAGDTEASTVSSQQFKVLNPKTDNWLFSLYLIFRIIFHKLG